ncbi:MAG: 6-phosphofructokinase [Oscillospiraceae bacterium]|nr:6-phosphofructokinase [Oscillospiraceae bacterium]
MGWGVNVLVGQSGGPTAVINSSLAGVFESARALGVDHVYGMEYGIEGLLQGKIVDLNQYLDDKMEIELLKRTPSSYLGSCRFKLPDPGTDERPFLRLFELFEKYSIGAVFYIGGNDSMDTIAKLAAYGAAKGSSIRFIGVPKTIDNDLMFTDHTPGYGSAAKYIATILKEVICDSSVYDIRSVTVAEIMGRHTGWLAGAASLAAGPDSPGPDIILLPERPFDEDAFLQRVAELEKTRHNVMIAASEGVKNRDGVFLCDLVSTAGQLDAFGHKAILSGTSRYLADLIRVRLGCKTRAIEFSTLQRCASHLASRTDVTEAYQAGGAAVEAAFEGQTGMMAGIRRISDQPYRTETAMVDVQKVANLEKKVPDSWITADGMGVTAEFERYARPLIQAELTPIYIDGVPRHLHLESRDAQ